MRKETIRKQMNCVTKHVKCDLIYLQLRHIETFSVPIANINSALTEWS